VNVSAVVVQNVKIYQLELPFFFIHLHIAFAMPMSTTCAPLITKVKNKTNKNYNLSQQNKVITDIRDLFS
jgi:predicted DNA-binding ribbon-helix-helix protein